MLVSQPDEWRCIRIDCPEWYARADFRQWLEGRTDVQNQQRTDGKPILPASWHTRGTQPDQMSDAFVVYDNGELSDPGLPEDVEAEITRIAEEQRVEHAVLWLSNCNLGEETPT